MTKEKIKKVQGWHELIDFIESINPNTKTVVVVGWINQLYDEKTHIRELLVSTMDVNILRDKKDGKKIKPNTKMVKKATRKRQPTL